MTELERHEMDWKWSAGLAWCTALGKIHYSTAYDRILSQFKGSTLIYFGEGVGAYNGIMSATWSL